jgi:hypothetical protein
MTDAYCHFYCHRGRIGADAGGRTSPSPNSKAPLHTLSRTPADGPAQT